jgi:hypothetical protein
VSTRTGFPPLPRTTRRTVRTGPHAHGCPTCYIRFDCTCATPTGDPECITCRAGTPAWALLADNRAPRPCCAARARPVTVEERGRYRLAGSCPWLICPACSRTHPFSIRKVHPR